MSELTHVELVWIKKRVENRIRFGRIAERHVIDRERCVVSFAAGSIFAFVRWVGNDYGTTVSRIDILRAVGPGERYATVPYVRPGGERVSYAFPAGRRSRRYCRRSTPSRRPASIRPMPRRIIGSTSTIASLSPSSRDRTPKPGIRPGCAAGA